MAKMAFHIQGAGIPIKEVGIGGADLILGFKTTGLRVFAVTGFGGTGVITVFTRRPFDIKDDPIVDALTDERISLELTGNQAMWGDLMMNFKIWKQDGSLGYEENHLVSTRGTSLGGWSMKPRP